MSDIDQNPTNNPNIYNYTAQDSDVFIHIYVMLRRNGLKNYLNMNSKICVSTLQRNKIYNLEYIKFSQVIALK